MSDSSSETANLSAAVRESVSDSSAARSFSDRHEFPSWTEVCTTLKELTNRTGVLLIDLYDFIDRKSHSCLTSKSEDSWANFVELFEEQYTR